MEFTYNCKICGGADFTCIIDNIKDWEYGFEGSYGYRKCSTCSSIQIHPFPSIQDLMGAYNVDYHGFAIPEQKGAIYSFFFRINEWLLTREVKNILHQG